MKEGCSRQVGYGSHEMVRKNEEHDEMNSFTGSPGGLQRSTCCFFESPAPPSGGGEAISS